MKTLYGVNPDTGRVFNNHDRNTVMNTYNRMCNTSEGSIGVCCNEIAELTSDEIKSLVQSVKEKYPSIIINKRKGVIENIEL